MTTKQTVLAFIASLVAVLALIAGIWALNVATSGVRGQGDAIVQRNSAQNWTAAQGRFEDMYADIVATDQKVTVARTALELDPDDLTAKQTLTGTQNVCLSMTADYNAEARKFLAGDFRASDLPAQISTTDPTTDCK